MPRKSKQSIPYNEQAIRKVAKTPHELQADYVIQGVPGLVLTVFPSGSASYAVRVTIDGKRKRESLGQFGVVSLADARTRALAIGAGAAAGVDMLAREAKDKAAPTLRQLWAERVKLNEERADRTMAEYGRSLEVDIFPKLGNRPARDVTAEDIAAVLMTVEARSKNAARHCRVALSSLYVWARKRHLVTVNPLAGLGFNHLPKARKRVLTDAEMRKLWQAIDDAPGLVDAVRDIIRLAILTGQRNSEVAGMECSELKALDTATPRWDIPAQRMKRKSADQHVPLSRQAAAIVRRALTASSNGLHVFEGAPNGRREGKWRKGHIGQESVSRAMAKVVKHAGLLDVHLHDMRKCVTSWLAEHGHATGEVLDAILHHGRQGVTGSHYNFAVYEKQVRTALQVWADHIGQIAGKATDASSAKVVRLGA